MALDRNECGTIRVVRRQIFQDAVRRYTVFVDGVPVGKLAARQSGQYSVAPGQHVVQLRIVNTGTSRSDEVTVSVLAGQTRVLKTKSLGVKNIFLAPLGIFNPDRFAPRPWIRLSLEP